MILNTLNESLDIIANLVIPRLEDDVDVIQKLDDEPNDVGGLTAAELKAKFDEAANIIKTYLNETLVPQLSDTVAEAEVRAQAEAERIANERARVEGENLREEAEDAREENEDARVQAEEARVSAESGRVAAESSRSSAESTRQNNEQQRQYQESTRQANEETRQSQESTRQTNEQTRQTQEQARATAEAQRAAAEATRRNTFATELSQAQTARSAAEEAAKAADEDAQYVEETKDLSKSWAVGGTGTREGEDTNNAMYWSKKAKEAAGGGVSSEQAAEIASRKVSEHDSDETAHADLRLAISGHLTDKNNPHNVTAEQVGAIAAGAVGNLHVWKKEKRSYTIKLSSGVTGQISINGMNKTIQYSYQIYMVGMKVALKNPVTLTYPDEALNGIGSAVKGNYLCVPGGKVYFAEYYEDRGDYLTIGCKDVTLSYDAKTIDYLTYKTASVYPYDDEVDGYHYTYLGQLGAQPSAEEIGAATTQDFTVSVTDAWDAVPDRGYSQRVSVSGIKSSDNPIVDVVLGSDIAANALYLEAYALVTRVTTSNSTITLYCNNEAPTVAFTIKMKVVR